ncbi:DUF3429 family protein [Reinekea blandensis]|uniref:DUF3429 domain-containing protein n=1 Tax=Reinekea blandensis MED297 TaxID=314283 RepID=A4B9Z4_9GAMM|nr:DUF3429 family protein [Reinekea blandensis]EAR11445.1 hypothetical protein MED297_21197 [Reinekea sp. MED297] [Reinekea blandensis MED297]
MRTPSEAILPLGTLGLVPFIVPGTMVLISPETDWAVRALQLYAFGIIAYLTGTWWLNPKPTETKAALIGHGLFLLAFFGLLLWPAIFFVLAALVLIAIYLVERVTDWVGQFESAYQRLRRLLTAVAVMSLVAGQIGVMGG